MNHAHDSENQAPDGDRLHSQPTSNLPGTSGQATTADRPDQTTMPGQTTPLADEEVPFPTLELVPKDAPMAPVEAPVRSTWKPQSPDEQIQAALSLLEEHHPRIALAIQATWGNPECTSYIERLLEDSFDARNQVRAGFKPQVSEALMLLHALHPAEAPSKPPARPPWPTR